MIEIMTLSDINWYIERDYRREIEKEENKGKKLKPPVAIVINQSVKHVFQYNLNRIQLWGHNFGYELMNFYVDNAEYHFIFKGMLDLPNVQERKRTLDHGTQLLYGD